MKITDNNPLRGNKQIYSSRKAERIKGYKKYFKKQTGSYEPPKKIVKELVVAMSALGYEIDEEQARAYMRSSYAVFDRDYFLLHIK